MIVEHQSAWCVGRNFCGYLILRFFPNCKNSQNIIPANDSNNKVDLLHTAVHFQSEHMQLSKSGCKRSSAAIGACKSTRQTSIDGPIPFTSEAHFHSHDVLWQGQTKSNEGFLGPMEKGFPLVSEGVGAVVRTLRTEHCFVTCDAVLMFFAVPKTTVNYFLRNWNTKLAKFFTSFVCLV